MGGEGQPQTQAALLTRYLGGRRSLGAAIDAPRWLLGRAWGGGSDALKLESRFAPEIEIELRGRGHRVELVEDYDEKMGHAGAIVRLSDGRLEGAADPRGDGAALSA